MLSAIEEARLITLVSKIARDAGALISSHYQNHIQVDVKSDHTPVTIADIQASQLICSKLKSLNDWPIISEEENIADFDNRKHWQNYWLIDPLDGTKEFIKGNGEYTVNIALIHQHSPILGVVFAPEYDQLFTGARHQGAIMKTPEGSQKLQREPSRANNQKWHIISGRSLPKPRFNKLLTQIPYSTITDMGSSLKVCHIAAGLADLYPRFGPTSEWDTAASQVILELAGGCIVDLEGRPLSYNQKDSLVNPDFAAMSTLDVSILEQMKTC